MRILGIETSCDETAAAVIEDGRTILSNVIASSQHIHKKSGGIIPEMAAREQIKCIIPAITEALMEAQISIEEIDAIAVTIGPGLIGSLLVGVESAKTIAYITKKPIIPVNHIFAHIYANWITGNKHIVFPAIALVVSGGHTELFLMQSHTKLQWLGGTRDDAAGEAFDKTARLLGLGYPGGPAIAAEAAQYQISKIKNQKYKIRLPRPMIGDDTLDFSFSGLKTAVLREVNKLKTMKQYNDVTISHLAYELQESITDVLVSKTLKAAIRFNAKSILLGGGVAANKRLSEEFNSQLTTYVPAEASAKAGSVQLFIPPPPLCTDNAAYIASYAYFHNKPIPWQKVQSQPDLRVEVTLDKPLS